MPALTFPVTLSDKYYFDLKFATYSRPNPFSGKINLSAPAAGAAAGIGAVRLPVPAHMVDSQTLKWVTEENIDGFIGAGAQMINGAINEGDMGSSGAQQAFGQGVKFLAGLTSMITSNKLMGTLGDPMALLLQSQGLALNPVLTQSFKHPEFKQHQFSWRLAPTTSQESKILQAIVDLIKFNSLPDLVAGGSFFSYPSIAMIEIHSGNNGSLYHFQPCVIQNITVNWAPTGVPAFFAGTNAPTEVQVDISLIEIILNTRSNIEQNSTSFSQAFDFSFGGLGDSTFLRNKNLSTIRDLL